MLSPTGRLLARFIFLVVLSSGWYAGWSLGSLFDAVPTTPLPVPTISESQYIEPLDSSSSSSLNSDSLTPTIHPLSLAPIPAAETLGRVFMPSPKPTKWTYENPWITRSPINVTTEKAQREAFVTMLYGNADLTYVEICKFWVRLLQHISVNRPILVVLVGDIYEKYSNDFIDLGALTRKVEPIDNPDSIAEFRDSFNKLRLWEFDDEWDKLVYMEPDTFVLSQDIQILFRYESFASVQYTPQPGDFTNHPYFAFSAALFVLKPSSIIFEDMMRRLPYCPWVDNQASMQVRSIQEFLNWYYLNSWHRLPDAFGMSMIIFDRKRHNPRYIPPTFTIRPLAVHLVCKPWATSCGSLGLGDQPVESYGDIFILWWRLYRRLLPYGNMCPPAAIRKKLKIKNDPICTML